MGDLGSSVLEQYLRVDSSVSLQMGTQMELAAVVQSIDVERVWLGLPRPSQPLPYRTGDLVNLKYWDEGSTIYGWEAQVLEVSSDNSRVALALTERDVTIQRRKSYRLRIKAPLSMTVISSSQSELTGQRISGLTTENISIGGLSFRTSHPLTVGDKLELRIKQESLHGIAASGWIVRVEPQREGQTERVAAVQFIQLVEAEQNQLIEFLKSYC